MRIFSNNEEYGNGRRGFTVGGLLLVLVAAGLLLALLIPVFQKAKDVVTLRTTVADMRMWEKAIKGYISDFGRAPTNPNGKISYKKPILRELMPYFERVRISDLWGSPYRIWTGAGIDKYGIKTSGAGDFIIVSLGKEGNQENWTYDPQRPQAGLYDLRCPEDFEKDLISWNGRFVRGPRNP